MLSWARHRRVALNSVTTATPVEPRTAFDRISLRRLVLIRSVAVTGQALTLLIVHFLLDFRLPLLPALIVVGASVLLNLGSMLFHRAGVNRSGTARRSVNHLYSTPIMKQQYDFPRALGDQPGLDPDIARLLGYTSQVPVDDRAWRSARAARIRGTK